MTLRQLDSQEPFVSLAQVKSILASAKDRYLLLLLTERRHAIPKVKPGIPALSYVVLDVLTDVQGPLDEALTNFCKQRPRVQYRRLLIDRTDQQVMTTLGVVWLPQVRLMRNGRVLFRSSVSVGDTGQFLAQDVGGRSYVRRVSPPASGFVSLTDALSAEIDRPRSPLP